MEKYNYLQKDNIKSANSCPLLLLKTIDTVLFYILIFQKIILKAG